MKKRRPVPPGEEWGVVRILSPRHPAGPKTTWATDGTGPLLLDVHGAVAVAIELNESIGTDRLRYEARRFNREPQEDHDDR